MIRSFSFSIENSTLAARLVLRSKGSSPLACADVEITYRVLVTAATGGVGGWLTQTLKAKGAHTIGTVSRQEKASIAKEQGTEIVLIEGEDDVVKVVKEKTNGQGVVAVFDSVGKVTFERSIECVARKGTMVSYGSASGAVEPFAIS